MQTPVPSTPGTSPRPRLSLPRSLRRPGSRPAAEKLATVLACIDAAARVQAGAFRGMADKSVAQGYRAVGFVAHLCGGLGSERPELAASLWALISDEPYKAASKAQGGAL